MTVTFLFFFVLAELRVPAYASNNITSSPPSANAESSGSDAPPVPEAPFVMQSKDFPDLAMHGIAAGVTSSAAAEGQGIAAGGYKSAILQAPAKSKPAPVPEPIVDLENDAVPPEIFELVDWLRAYDMGMYFWTGTPEKGWTAFAMHIPSQFLHVRVVPSLHAVVLTSV